MQGRPIWSQHPPSRGWEEFDWKAQPRWSFGTGLTGQGFDSLSHIANPGYQPNQEPNLCPCYVTFVTPPAATCKILLYQKKDTNRNRDEQ
ncbi:hypothetical protein TURU_152222 [Turdus rufiventris]|nr:hypothetical protein TURU_152222 [Turdus rufiventris]